MDLIKTLLGSDDGTDDIIKIASLFSTISNIIHSYDNPFDQLPEMVQNALDSMEYAYDLATENGTTYEPVLELFFDEKDRALS